MPPVLPAWRKQQELMVDGLTCAFGTRVTIMYCYILCWLCSLLQPKSSHFTEPDRPGVTTTVHLLPTSVVTDCWTGGRIANSMFAALLTSGGFSRIWDGSSWLTYYVFHFCQGCQHNHCEAEGCWNPLFKVNLLIFTSVSFQNYVFLCLHVYMS